MYPNQPIAQQPLHEAQFPHHNPYDESLKRDYEQGMDEYSVQQDIGAPEYKVEDSPEGGVVATLSWSAYSVSSGNQSNTSVARDHAAYLLMQQLGVISNDTPYTATPDANPNWRQKKRKMAELQAIPLPPLPNKMKGALHEVGAKAHKLPPTYASSNNPSGYKSVCTFEGQQFASSQFFTQKKMAEHNSAHVAMFELSLVPTAPDGYVKGASVLPSTNGTTIKTETNGVPYRPQPQVVAAGPGASKKARKAQEAITDHPVLRNRLEIFCQRSSLSPPKYTTEQKPNQKDFDPAAEPEVKKEEEEKPFMMFIGGLNFETTEETAKAFVDGNGVRYTWFKLNTFHKDSGPNKKQGMSKGSVLVNCEDQSDCDKLLALTGQVLEEKEINVCKSVKKERKSKHFYHQSTVEVSGISYTGEVRPSRKEAEKSAGAQACAEMGLMQEGELVKNGIVVTADQLVDASADPIAMKTEP